MKQVKRTSLTTTVVNGKQPATTTMTHMECTNDILMWWNKDTKRTLHSNSDWQQRPMVKIRG